MIVGVKWKIKCSQLEEVTFYLQVLQVQFVTTYITFVKPSIRSVDVCTLHICTVQYIQMLFFPMLVTSKNTGDIKIKSLPVAVTRRPSACSCSSQRPATNS